MPPKKEFTKHQISHRLQFQSHTPNFLRAFQAKVSGFRTGDGDEDEDAPQYANGDEFATGGDEPVVDEFGREIRRGSEEPPKAQSRRDKNPEEDEEDEMPTVVVLKEGKHLSAREAENERRRARGLSPLPESDQEDKRRDVPSTSTTQKTIQSDRVSASTQKQKSGVQLGAKASGAKRKVPLGGREDEQDDGGPASKRMKSANAQGAAKKDKKDKTKKKAIKGLLSFGDDG